MSKRKMIAGLRYIGHGWLPGVPARDLSPEEAEIHGMETLLGSGLYEAIKQEKLKIQDEKIEEEEHGS